MEMNTDNSSIRDALERVPAAVLAAVACFLVFAAINAGFTPHAADPAGQTFGRPALSL
jgi:hypothetical protein